MANFSEGLYPGMSFEDYAAIDAINYSSLKHMMRSPLVYRWHKDHPQPPTPAMILGTATHRVLLEPERVGDFAVWTGGRRQSKAWDAFCVENEGRFIVNEDERDAMVGMAVAVRKNVVAARYLSGGKGEVSVVWVDRATKRLMKARFDYLPNERREVIGLKTARDARPFRFGNEAYRLGYHIQWALYRDAYYTLFRELPDMKEIVVESKAPHETVVYHIPDEVIQQGKDDMSRLLLRLFECEKTGVWPGEYEEEQQLSLPTYAYGDTVDDLSDLELITQ